VLHVEDSPDDSELLDIQLRRAGFDAAIRRVDTALAFCAALDGAAWDVVIVDHAMPNFDAATALALLKQRKMDMPFVVLSGVIREDWAIELMRAGAQDVVSKTSPARLEPVIRRELREAENRRARVRAEAERERVIGELEIAHRVKDEFLAMLGHELRNPMAPIVTALELLALKREGKSCPELDIIARQVAQLTRLLDDLLDVSRITEGKVALKRHPVELAVVVATAVEMTRPMFVERRHQLTVEVPAKGFLLDADEARLAQVLSNLLRNAAHYTLAGGTISLTATQDDAHVVVRVRDNGVGINAATMPMVFELFVQGARPVDRTLGGLGIGLTIVRDLVLLHGGSVGAYSGGGGEGSEFTIRLPLIPAVETPAATTLVTPAEPRAVPGQRVLLVDDNVDAVLLLATLLRLEGHEVQVAHDGLSALALLDGFSPSVIILDIGLPLMDGHTLARHIRARAAQPPPRLIALTGYGQPSDREKSFAAGIDVHLVKPVEMATLMSVLV